MTDVLAVDGNLSISSGERGGELSGNKKRDVRARDNLTDIHKTRQSLKQASAK